MRFLAIGECMAELAPTATPDEFRLGFAGDTFNTAWYLARCAPQIDVGFLTVVGNDAISAKMRNEMRGGGISDACVDTHPAKTIGLYLISLEDGERSFAYWRGQSAARTLADDPASLAEKLADADFLYFSGITLAILPADRREGFLHALATARKAGKTIAFDPNLRPKLWASTEEMTQSIMDGAAVSDLVLPSFEDEAHWFADADPDATAQRYLDAGAITVVVKNGADPVHYAEAERRGSYPISPIRQLVDTTAAGDSFNAGIFARHGAGDSLEQGIAYACALSGQVVQGRGALVPVDVDSLMKLGTS